MEEPKITCCNYHRVAKGPGDVLYVICNHVIFDIKQIKKELNYIIKEDRKIR